MKPERCPTCKRRLVRSNEANRKYWALLHLIAEQVKPTGNAYGVDSWHLYFKSKFLGRTDYELPGGKVIAIPKSSADLDVAEFGTYLDKVEAWAAEHDCYLADTEWAE